MDKKMAMNSSGKDFLTEREQEVMALIATGISPKEVADKLFISPETVRKHLQNIYSKLEVNNKVAAINKIRL